jgi:peptidoglycan hydrolase CwlO-like protein
VTDEMVKRAFQDLIAPELERLRGQMSALDVKIGALDAKIDAVRFEIRSLEKRLDETLSIRERLAALEATMRSGHQ